MTTINPATTSTGAGAVSNSLDNTEIASNFTTFLQLLTTQLKNQNPLDPLDTNQFTQQLVQFAQVEQQMKSNDQLSSLVSLEKSAQATTALAYVGATVVVDGSTAQLTGGTATGASTSPSRRRPRLPSRIRPARTFIPARLRLILARRISPGTGAATTVAFGPTAPIRSLPRQSTPTSNRWPFRPRYRRSWTRSISRRTRLSSRSMDRTTRSTRSSGSSGRPRNRGVRLQDRRRSLYYRLLTRSGR